MNGAEGDGHSAPQEQESSDGFVRDQVPQRRGAPPGEDRSGRGAYARERVHTRGRARHGNAAAEAAALLRMSGRPLGVVGCARQGPADVGGGAFASMRRSMPTSVRRLSVRLSGVVNTTSRTRFKFLPVVEGIARKTIILGYAALMLLALLGGCRSEAPAAQPDAGTVSTSDLGAGGDLGHPADVPTTINRDVGTRPRPDIVFPDDVVAEDVQLLDAPANRDAGNPLTGDVIQYASLGPARQQRHRCPEITDGDPTIAAPRLIYPLSGTRATSRRPGFRWELAAGTTGARVEVCADPCCARVITAYDAVGASRRPVEMLPPGVVWWRARSNRRRIRSRHLVHLGGWHQATRRTSGLRVGHHPGRRWRWV